MGTNLERERERGGEKEREREEACKSHKQRLHYCSFTTTKYVPASVQDPGAEAAVSCYTM